MSHYLLKQILFGLSCLAIFSLAGCDRAKSPVSVIPPPMAVTTLRVTPLDTPVDFEFIGFVTSPRNIEIRARVEGFMDERFYHEGSMVKAGQPLFQLDRKPFEAALQQANGELKLRQAQLDNAADNLRRVEPLAKKKAVSLRDLDSAINQQKSAAAALLSAQGAVRQADLNLGYTKISAPMAGVVGKALVAEGSFVSPGLNGLLTSVTQIDPIRVSFDVTENALLQVINQTSKGVLFLPKNNKLTVEVVLADGSIYPKRGRIDFTEQVFNTQTGTYKVEAELPNPEGSLRPGQFVRARIKGAFRPKATLIPQSTVTEGAKGPFVWVVDPQHKAQLRYLQLGPWHHDQWFVDAGLKVGELVVLDNTKRLSPGMLVNPEAETAGAGK